MPVIEAPTRSEDEALALVYAKARGLRRQRRRLRRRMAAGAVTALVGASAWLLVGGDSPQHRAVYALPAPLSGANSHQVVNELTERYMALGYGGVRTYLTDRTARVEWRGGAEPTPGLAGELGAAGRLSLRPVLGTTSAPCPDPGVSAGSGAPAEAADPSDPHQCLELGPVQLSNLVFSSTSAVSDSGQWIVRFTVAPQDVAAFDTVNAANLGHRVAMVVDGQVLSAPVVHNAAFHGQGQISGHFDQARAEALAVALRYGLPASLPVLSVR